MAPGKRSYKEKVGTSILKRYARVRSSIYGQVVYVITILSVFLFCFIRGDLFVG